MYQGNHIAAIIPARDEASSIGLVVKGLIDLKDANNKRIIDKIVVCDNGSADKTAIIAQQAGASVITQNRPGYGIACMTALTKTKDADILLFIDGDNAFRAQQAIPLLSSVANGVDLAIGSRKLGRIEKHALTIPQQFGNWLAAYLIKLLWGKSVTDLGPFRAISQQALQRLSMEDETYGWTIEMQIKAIQSNMAISELPVDTYRRLGQSKISGTVKGTIGAGTGILSMIACLRWRQFKQISKQSSFSKSLKDNSSRL